MASKPLRAVGAISAFVLIGTLLAPTGAGGSTRAQGGSEPIVVMTIGDFDNPQIGQSYPELPGAVKARAKVINKNGGINGRKVKVISCNSGFDQDRTGQCARDAVDEGVVALIGANSVSAAEIYSVIEPEGIPSIAPSPNSPFAANSKMAFPVNGGVVSVFYAMPQQLVEEGAEKIGFVYPGDVPGSSAAAKMLVERSVEEAGAELVNDVPFNQGTADLGPAVASAAADDVDGLIAFGTGDAEGLILRQVQQQGIKDQAKVITAPNFLPQELIESLGEEATEDILLVGPFQPVTATKVPGIRMFRKDMKAFDKDLSLTEQSLNAWLGMWVFERVAKTLDTVDSASVLEAMGQLEDLDMGGVTPPLTTNVAPTVYQPPYTRIFNPTVVIEVIKNQKVTAVNGDFVNPFTGDIVEP